MMAERFEDLVAAQVVAESDDEIVRRSRNRCPTLEAHRHLGSYNEHTAPHQKGAFRPPQGGHFAPPQQRRRP